MDEEYEITAATRKIQAEAAKNALNAFSEGFLLGERIAQAKYEKETSNERN